MPLFITEARERSLEQALALGPALLARTASDGAPQMAASLVSGPAVVLGVLQRAGRVVDLAACAQHHVHVLRRATSGTAVHLGRQAIVWTLVLPHVASLAPDASARTLLNRNIRGFLQGLTRAGAPAHYFGREWVSVKHRPLAVVGFEVMESGEVLLELFAGVDASLALPPFLATELERSTDRWKGKLPAALSEVYVSDLSARELATSVMEAVAQRAGLPLQEAPAIAEHPPVLAITRATDPLPEGFAEALLIPAPIGWIETAVEAQTGALWIGGDVLVPSFVARAIAERVATGRAEALPFEHVPIEGARLSDLVEAALETKRRMPVKTSAS